MENRLAKFLVIQLIFVCITGCDDAGNMNDIEIRVRNVTDFEVQLAAKDFRQTIEARQAYTERRSGDVHSPPLTAFPFDLLAIIFSDGKELKYFQDQRVPVNGAERNPLSSESYQYESIDGLSTYIYTITEEDYQRAN